MRGGVSSKGPNKRGEFQLSLEVRKTSRTGTIGIGGWGGGGGKEKRRKNIRNEGP